MSESSCEQPRADYPPASVLRSRLVDIDAQRAETHAKIAELRADLAVLAKARGQVVEDLKSVTYPILTIPPEITTQIFEHYVDVMAEEWASVEAAPNVLTHVCRAWRRIALATPKLTALPASLI